MRPFRIPLAWLGQSTLLLVPGIFFEAFLMVRVSGGVTVGDALILTSAVLLIAQALQGRAHIFMPPWLLLAFPLVIAGTVADAMFVGHLGRADVIVAIELAFCVILLPSIVASQSPDRDLARRLVLAWVAGNLVGAAIAYGQFHRFDLRLLDRWLVWNSGRVAGMTPNPNTLGASLALLAPMCLAFMADARRLLPMAVWAAAVLLCVHVIDLTGSRTSIVAAALGCAAVVLLFAARIRREELPLRLAQLACILAAVVVASQMQSGYHDSAIERVLGHSASARISTFFRDALTRYSLEAIATAPFFGYGYGSMAHAAHNVPMALIQGGGLAAFAGFVLAQTGLLVAAVRLYLQSRNDASSRGIAIGMLGVWCVWLALGIYDVSVLNRNAYIALAFPVLWLAASRAAAPASVTPLARVRAHAA